MYCGKKIEKGKETWEYVKVPEFSELKKRPFCNEDHAEDYDKNVFGTPSPGGCLKCTA